MPPFSKIAFADEESDILRKCLMIEKSGYGKPSINEKGLSLVRDKQFHPQSYTHPKIDHLALPFHDFTVNVWGMKTDFGYLLIDSSTGKTPLDSELASRSITPDYLLITHNDVDHVGGMEYLKAAFPRLILKPPPQNETINTPGHRAQHVSYYFPDEKVCFCGDALFAGSIGRPNDDPEKSLASLNLLLELPEDTLLLPGHGPATRVDWERQYNCFYTSP